MKLHPSVVAKIIQICHHLSGHSTEKKLHEELSKLDLTAYQKKTGDQQTVLVTTEDYIKEIQGSSTKR